MIGDLFTEMTMSGGVCRCTKNSFSIWINGKVPTLMVNIVVETKSDMTLEWYSHAELHSCSLNAGQSGKIDLGAVE